MLLVCSNMEIILSGALVAAAIIFALAVCHEGLFIYHDNFTAKKMVLPLRKTISIIFI